MNIKENAIICARALDERHGRDVKIIDVGDKSSFTDYIILVSAKNERLLGALTEEAENIIAKTGGLSLKSIEGKKESGWILMDYGDMLVNILTEEMREKYNIEKIWADCDILDWKEED